MNLQRRRVRSATIAVPLLTLLLLFSLGPQISGGGIAANSNLAPVHQIVPAAAKMAPHANAVSLVSRHVRVAVVEPIFTTTAYSSFYEFYRDYAGVPTGALVKTNLNLLNATIAYGWGYSYGLYSFITSDAAKRAGLIVGNNTQILTDISVNNGKLFDPSTGARKFDVVVLGFTEYVTAAEYSSYEHFVATGGKIIFLTACNFIAEVSYNPTANKLALVKGHGWVFDGSAAWKGHFHRWYTENTNWIGSEYELFYTEGYHFNGAIANVNNSLGSMLAEKFGVHIFTSYNAHEENIITNSTDKVIAIWQVSNLKHPGWTVAAYEHYYRLGVVIHTGVFGTDVIATDKGMQYLLLASIFMTPPKATPTISVTIANSAPPAEVTVNSCHPSPSTFHADGAIHTITMDPACLFTISFTNSGDARNGFDVEGTLSATSISFNSSAGAIVLTAYRQVSMQFGYSLIGGGSGYMVPSVSYFYLGSGSTRSENSSFTSIWLDFNTPWNVSAQLSGSSSTERWTADSGASGRSVASASQTTTVYYHQFQVSFDYGVVGGGMGFSPPTIEYAQFGDALSVKAGTTVWSDANSKYTYSNPLIGSGTRERWQAPSGTSGTINGQLVIQPTYYHQFGFSINYTVIGGGSPNPPIISGIAYSKVLSATLARSISSLIWLDSGTRYSIPSLLSQSTGSERWVSSSTDMTGIVTSPMSQFLHYDHEYYVALDQNVRDAGQIAQKSGWFSAGSTMLLIASVNPGWQFERWNGTGMGSYTGVASSVPIVINVAINESATFYPGITITSSGGGSTNYKFAGIPGVVTDGETKTVYVPPGSQVSISDNPSSILFSFGGWSGAASGNKSHIIVVVVNSPETVKANFAYSYLNISILFAIIAAVSLGLTLALIKRINKTRID